MIDRAQYLVTPALPRADVVDRAHDIQFDHAQAKDQEREEAERIVLSLEEQRAGGDDRRDRRPGMEPAPEPRLRHVQGIPVMPRLLFSLPSIRSVHKEMLLMT